MIVHECSRSVFSCRISQVGTNSGPGDPRESGTLYISQYSMQGQSAFSLPQSLTQCFKEFKTKVHLKLTAFLCTPLTCCITFPIAKGPNRTP